MRLSSFLRIVVVTAFVLLPGLALAGRATQVRGYVRKDGTYVRPHYRSGSSSSNLSSSPSYRSNYRTQVPAEPTPRKPGKAPLAVPPEPPRAEPVKVEPAKTPAESRVLDALGFVAFGVVAVGFLAGGVVKVRRSRERARQAAEEDARSAERASEQQARSAEQARLAKERAERLQHYKNLLVGLPPKFDDEALAAIRAAREADEFTFESLWQESYDAVGGIASAMFRAGTTPSDLLERLEPAASAVGMSGDTFDRLKAHALRAIIWSFLDDKLLTEDEEAFVTKLRETLSVSAESIREELQALDQYRRLRDVTPWSLPAVSVEFKLRDGEVCYHVTSGALKEKRVTRSYVRDGRRMKEEEWVAVREGDIYFTSERILIVGGGTTQIPNDKILAVEMDWGAGVIEVTKDGRKTPFYVAVADPIYSGNLISIIRQAA